MLARESILTNRGAFVLIPTEEHVLQHIWLSHQLNHSQVAKLVAQYIQIRNYLIGGDIHDYQPHDTQPPEHEMINQRQIKVNNDFKKIYLYWVGQYSPERPGKPVIGFIFPKINGRAADICYNNGFTLNLLYTTDRANDNWNGSVPNGWETWNQSERRTNAVIHCVNTTEELDKLKDGIDHWKIKWGLNPSDSLLAEKG